MYNKGGQNCNIFAERLATCKIKYTASVLKRKKINSLKVEKLFKMVQVSVPKF